MFCLQQILLKESGVKLCFQGTCIALKYELLTTVLIKASTKNQFLFRYLSRQQASGGSHRCCTLHVLPVKRVIQTGRPSHPQQNKDQGWSMALYGKLQEALPPQLRCERAAKLTMNPPGAA